MGTPRLVLASGSPRRREFLRLLGLSCDVVTAEIDEAPWPHEDPVEMVRRLSLEKARAVAGRVTAGALVIGADTVVVCDGQMLGKPRNADEARQMLRALRGRTHWVHSGVSVVDAGGGSEISTATTSAVLMRGYSDDEIERYIESGDPFDKAGAYAIQHSEFHPVDAIDGCYASVMGLPLCHLAAALAAFNAPLALNAAAVCRQVTGHPCWVAPPEIIIRPAP